MSDNKFILQLKGTQTPKSVVEIKNDKLVAPFVNVPGSSDAVGSIIQDKDSSVVVAKGAENWQLDGGALVPATNLTGDGADFTGEYAVSGSGLWVNATYTFPSTGDPVHPVAEIFNPQTKWVLQLCGKNLHTGNGNTIDFAFIVKIGSSHIMTKTVTVSEQANFFCKRFVLDFSESEQSIIKASGGSNLTVQLLCADDSASATIYNGMTILTALQRRIDASEVSASFANVEEVMRDGMLPSDYFSNAEFIDQVEDGEQAYAVFERDGDNVNLAGWTPKDEVARKEEIIVKSTTIPTASADLLGAVYQYVGQTDSTYEHGYIYECVAETTTETLIMFDPVGTGKLSFNYTNHSVYELFDRIAAILGTFNAEDVVSGSLTLDKPNELWYISGYDANGNALFTNFTVAGTGDEYSLDAYGFVYTFPFPDDYEDGHTENFTIVQDQQSVYSWERIDVQPNSEAEIAELQADVAEIQSVIPAQASTSNQLADKAFVQTGLDSKQDNLTATDGLTLNNNVISGKPLQDDIADINTLIPNQATAQNQLADKAFVNSSIETNTATFRGTYNTLAELEAQPADNNDYGFVVSTDAAGNTVYNRYKYNGTAWVFEYALNNSSFTANQWAAINSNATNTKIAQIDTNKNTINNHIANVSNPHQVTKAQVGLGNVNNTSDADKPISTATQAALNTKAPLDTYLAPNFDGLTPIATYEFDTSSTSFYKLLTFNNIYATTEAIPVAHALFRITTTIGGKTSIIDALVETQKLLAYMRILSNHTTGYTASTNTGVRYMRSSFPKALNDGNDWELDINAHNSTARHIKVEVFQSDEGFTWFADGSVSTITTNTHTSTTITYYSTQGTIIHPSLNVNVTGATSATYISNRLPKLVPGTMPVAGAALLPNQICFMSNSLVYPATENTVPINTGFGLVVSYSGTASGAATTFYYILQKYSMSLANTPHDTLDRGAPCFFRCTMDANGNIFSDNYVATEMTPGYTWYYVGVASSATAIMFDTTSSVFLTLDANGNLTHVNGKKISGGGGGGSLPDQTGHAGEFLTTDGTDASWSDAIGYHPDLFDHKWADHILNDVQWLRADTFSWQSGVAYEEAYQHLADDIDGKTLQSETIGSTTIQFYLADDGHKICPASEESNVVAIYNATGVAWYYIIDTVNQQFKLPRTKHNKYAETLGVVGNNTDIHISSSGGTVVDSGVYGWAQPAGSGYRYWSNAIASQTAGSGLEQVRWTTDVTKSGLIANQAQDTDQYKYLYFYVGSFTQTALENTAGLNASLFNGKADLNLLNTASNVDFVIDFQVPNAGNNYTWYRKYRSGWVEQGGVKDVGDTNNPSTVSLPVTMADANYFCTIQPTNPTTGAGSSAYIQDVAVYNFTTTSFGINRGYNGPKRWTVCGMAAQ